MRCAAGDTPSGHGLCTAHKERRRPSLFSTLSTPLPCLQPSLLHLSPVWDFFLRAFPRPRATPCGRASTRDSAGPGLPPFLCSSTGEAPRNKGGRRRCLRSPGLSPPRPAPPAHRTDVAPATSSSSSTTASSPLPRPCMHLPRCWRVPPSPSALPFTPKPPPASPHPFAPLPPPAPHP